jgi:Holliday junction DNA helicase RuvA
MIARLKGILEEMGKGTVIVDVQGVGYGLHVPETVFLRLPEQGGEVTLQVYTHVREDHIALYGFLTKLDKDVFEILLSASGVGPKLALTILSSLESGQVIEAVAQGNKVLFNGISGVGKKTVEKLFVEIREKCEKRLLLERGGGEAGTSQKRVASSILHGIPWMNDLEQALQGLGYKDADIRLAIRDLMARDKQTDFDTALRAALSFLSGGVKNSLRGNA